MKIKQEEVDKIKFPETITNELDLFYANTNLSKSDRIKLNFIIKKCALIIALESQPQF